MGSVYSPGHEFSPDNPPPRRRRGRKTAAPTDVDTGLSNMMPIRESVKNPTMSEQARRELRAKQVMARQGSIGQELSGDLRRDQVKTLERFDTQYGQNVVPEINPKHHGVAPGEKHSEHLAFDQDFNEVERDHDMRLSAAQEELARFATLSAFDQVLQAFDGQLTASFTAVRTLKQSAAQLKTRMSREQQDPQLGELAGEIYTIIDQAVEPWLLEVESYFDQIANHTVEGTEG